MSKLSVRALLNLDANCWDIYAINTVLTVHTKARFYMTFKWDFVRILKKDHPQTIMTLGL